MFKFFGAKYRLAPHYPPPRHRLIVEPFAGGAGYAVHHRRDHDVLLIEKDRRVVDLWRRLLGMSVADLLALPDPTPGAMSSDLLVAFAAGRTTRDTPVTFQVSPRMAQRFRPMVNRMATVLDECRHFQIQEGDYHSAPYVEATWFVDPPYQYQGGRWDRTSGGRYQHSSRDLDYDYLAFWCNDRPGQLIVCEQAGATWMPWNSEREARDSTHTAYREVWYQR